MIVKFITYVDKCDKLFTMDISMDSIPPIGYNIELGFPEKLPCRYEIVGGTLFIDKILGYGVNAVCVVEPTDKAVGDIEFNSSGINPQEELVTLMNSCVEGYHAEWDVTTHEGLNGFDPMYESLKRLADYFHIDVSKAREI